VAVNPVLIRVARRLKLLDVAARAQELGQEIALSGVLEEFRIALREEIDLLGGQRRRAASCFSMEDGWGGPQARRSTRSGSSRR
jgi:hypothetical protein